MEEFIEIQNYHEVQQINNKKETNDLITDQIEQSNNNMSIISSQLYNLNTIINDIESPTTTIIDEVSNKIDEMNTNIITAQTADILDQLNDQQERINNIEDKLDQILEALR